MGFAEILTEFKTALETDPGLRSYASSAWGKAPTVKTTWRNREEISSTDLPLILITRPSSARKYGTSRQRLDYPIVRLYAGFYQPEEKNRQIQLIEFEEKILGAIEQSETFRQYFDWESPIESANDEAALGETCFCVIQLGMSRRSTV
jgi:hypothetical protein